APLLLADGTTVVRGDRTLLDQVAVAVEPGDRIGIVGRNGAGKSTLLAVLAGDVGPIKGRVVRTAGARVALVAQGDALPAGTVRRAIVGTAAEHEWAADPRIRNVLEGLFGSVTASLLDADTATLSGGEARRTALAAALTADFDVLLLDEPTNHLDLRAIRWLAEFLVSMPRRRAVVVVTHDRWFLDEVTRRTWEVHDGCVDSYEGGYAAYVLARAERDRQDAAAEARRRNLVRKELAWLRRGPPARTSKPKFRIDAANALIEDVPAPRDSMTLRRVAAARLGKKVLELREVDISPAPGIAPILESVTWGLGPGDRIGVVGANGAGKSTLLRLVRGADSPPHTGVVDRGVTVVAEQLDQRLPDVGSDERVLEWLRREGERVVDVTGEERTPGQLLEEFGLAADTGWKRLSDLSGGELRRVHLLRMFLRGANLIILDEPTNDLDIDTLTVLEDVLDAWPGTLVVVSHDRYFLERVCDEVYLVADGRLRHLPGGVEQYLASLASGETADGAVPRAGRPDVDGRAAAIDPVSPADTRAARKRMQAVERRLTTIDTTAANVHEQMAEAATDPERLEPLVVRLAALDGEREVLEEEWLELAESAD
ncbi:MAG: hypothetical protein RLZ55_365, partial [Actinomycetota bacterium]